MVCPARHPACRQPPRILQPATVPTQACCHPNTWHSNCASVRGGIPCREAEALLGLAAALGVPPEDVDVQLVAARGNWTAVEEALQASQPTLSGLGATAVAAGWDGVASAQSTVPADTAAGWPPGAGGDDGSTLYSAPTFPDGAPAATPAAAAPASAVNSNSGSVWDELVARARAGMRAATSTAGRSGGNSTRSSSTATPEPLDLEEPTQLAAPPAGLPPPPLLAPMPVGQPPVASHSMPLTPASAQQAQQAATPAAIEPSFEAGYQAGLAAAMAQLGLLHAGSTDAAVARAATPSADAQLVGTVDWGSVLGGSGPPPAAQGSSSAPLLAGAADAWGAAFSAPPASAAQQAEDDLRLDDMLAMLCMPSE